jgi:hypothetical protein
MSNYPFSNSRKPEVALGDGTDHKLICVAGAYV